MRRFVAAIFIIGSSTAIAAPRAVQVALSEGHACALLDDGSVRCWGDGLDHDGEQHTPVAVPGVANGVELAMGQSGACVRHADNTATCWGDSSFLELDATEHPNPRPHVVAALAHASALWLSPSGDGCAPYADGSRRCWGTGGGYVAVGVPGQYGSGPANVVPALAHATQIAVGESLGCARMADGTAMCWGRNDAGQIGDGTTEMRLAPVRVAGLANVERVVVGRESACALIHGGSVKCWGSNDAGQLGDGTTQSSSKPVEVKAVHGATALVAGELDVCAIVDAGKLTCWGFDRDGQLGNGARADSSGPVQARGLADVRSVSLAFSHSCAVTGAGDVYCWGQGWRGVIGDGLQADRDSPTKVAWARAPVHDTPLPAGVHPISVAVSMNHTCAALSDGSVRCWGRNDDGMVDVAGAKQSFEQPVVVPGVANAMQVSVGMFDSFARRADGSVLAWGRKAKPTVVSASPLDEFSDADGVSCSLRGDLATCSLNDGMQPKQISLHGVAHVVASDMFACVVMKAGDVRCAGINNHGQLGDGTTTDRDDFVAVKGLTDVVQVAMGYYIACAVRRDGSTWCWGDVAMTGQGDAIQTDARKVAGLGNAIAVAAGADSACVRTKSGAVYCWGQLRPVDLGTRRDDWHSDTPREISALRGAKQLALGQSHSCAITATDAIACWGENEAGELGDGTMDARRDPVLVRW